jgi:hypothetical protein
MNTIEHDLIVEALETCLERIQAGASLEQALAAYPQWVEELRPLLLAAQSAQTLGKSVLVPKAARARSRAAFLQAARQTAQTRQDAFTWRFGLGLLAILIVLATGAATTAAVSARALPGESLYPVKIAAERTRLLLAGAPLKRLELEQSFDKERIEEVETLSQRYHDAQSSHLQEVTFAGGLTQMQPGEWLVGGVRVIIPPEVTLNSEIMPGDYVEVNGILQPDGSVLATQVQERQIEISGKIQAVGPNNLVVSGITVVVNPESQFQGSPDLGTMVHVHAFWMADGSLLARLVEVIGGGEQQPTITFIPTSKNGGIQPTWIPERTETAEPENTFQPTRRAEPTEPPEPTEVDGEHNTPHPTDVREPHGTPAPTEVRNTEQPHDSTEEAEPTHPPRSTEDDSGDHLDHATPTPNPGSGEGH